MTAECPVCERPQVDGILCASCERRLVGALTALPELFAELRNTLTRQTKSGESLGKTSETPLVFDENSSNVRDEAIETVASWVGTFGLYFPERTMSAWCAGFLAEMAAIRAFLDVAAFFEDITRVTRDVRKAVDTRPGREFAGRCDECSAAIYARQGAAEAGETTTCKPCADQKHPDDVLHYDVAARRAGMLAEFRAGVATKQQILAACPINPGTFRAWLSRGRISAVTWDGKLPLYSVDAVMSLHEAAQEKKRAQEAMV